MFKSLIHSRHPSIERFLEILNAQKFDQHLAEKMLPKINKNYRFDDGDTLLDVCLRNNRFKAASWLVQQGIQITTKNKTNISTVRLAIEKGDIVVVDNIVKHAEFNINQVDSNGRSLLQDAVILGYDKISQILINEKIDVNLKDSFNRNVIFDAINYGSVDIVDLVLSVDGIELNNIDATGKTVLHQKPVLDNDELAIKLLEKGANPSIFNNDGYSFLTYTALRGKEGQEILDTAIKYGCNLNIKNSDQSTVLMEVLQSFSKIDNTEIEKRKELKDVASTLIKGGSELNDVNQNGETMLFTMIRKGDRDGCSFLLDNKIDPNLQNNNKDTPLHIAVLKGSSYLDMIHLLIQYGADPTIGNKYHHTIPEVLNEIILQLYNLKQISHREYLASISVNGQYMVVLKNIIKLKQYNFSYLDTHGYPLFFIPFLYGDIKTTQLYFANGFDINQKNNEGYNLFYAYVLKCFEKGEYFKEFRDNLVFLLVNEADIRIKNKEDQGISSRVALIENCNLKLFRKLVEITKQDYKAVDKKGRTIIHNSVFSNNIELLKLVYGVEQNIQNICDNHNLLPITYAALFGYQDIVIELLRRDAVITSGKPISKDIKEKFKPFLKNIDDLTLNIDDTIMLRKLTILKDQILLDFT
ncbi:MAG: ankyrin repeat domain-containing protein [Campylobacterota bacterium]|nr:ankyrin repeat domain-containing protein [Campylobacterota bacterium]